MAKRKNFDENEEMNEDVQLDEQEVTNGESEQKVERKPSPKTIARNAIFSWMEENKDELPAELADLYNAFSSVPGRVSAGGIQKNSVASQIRAMFEESETIHEDVFYEKFKIGRLEMKRRCYNLRKKNADPKDNIYVSFEKETGLYHVEGTGENAPAGFDD